MKSVGVLAVGHFLPKNRLTNRDLEKMVDTSDDWIVTRTGIRERRFVNEGEKTSSLAIGAGKEALKKFGLKASDLDLIIVATVTADSNFPSTACLVQKALGAHKAFAFDISAACAGYLYAMSTARQFIRAGTCRYALVIAAETMTSIIDWKDRNTCVLFGDGAGACLLGAVPKGKGILAEHLESLGEYSDLMSVVVDRTRHPLTARARKVRLPYVTMQGQEIFKIAVSSMSESVTHACHKAKIKLSDVACVVPHQANDRIISAVAKKLDIPKEKFFINIDRYGNMSAASIAVALYEAVKEKRIRKDDLVLMVAFGAGLVSAANVIRW